MGGLRFLAAISAAIPFVGVAAVARADVSAPRQEAGRLGVLTFNAFGVPRLSPAIDERMAAMAPAIAALEPDVVLMQEVWRAEDAETLFRAFRGLGYVSVRSFAADHWLDRGRGGLFVASRLPIVAERFEPFEVGALPHIPWHADWRGGKGFLTVRVATPLGDVAIAVAHTQASYATGSYEALRVAQALQIARALDPRGGGSAVARPRDPLVIAGDFNAAREAPSVQLLRHLAEAAPVGPALELDLVLARSGPELGLSPVSVDTVLETPIPLADGARVPLSDHPGVLVRFAIERCASPCPRPPVDARAAAVAAVAELEADAQRTTWLRAGTTAGAGASALLAVRVARRVRTGRRRRDRAAAAALTSWCLFWAAWWTYTAFVFSPAHLDGLDRARGFLEEAFPTRHAPVTVDAPPPR